MTISFSKLRKELIIFPEETNQYENTNLLLLSREYPNPNKLSHFQTVKQKALYRKGELKSIIYYDQAKIKSNTYANGKIVNSIERNMYVQNQILRNIYYEYAENGSLKKVTVLDGSDILLRDIYYYYDDHSNLIKRTVLDFSSKKFESRMTCKYKFDENGMLVGQKSKKFKGDYLSNSDEQVFTYDSSTNIVIQRHDYFTCGKYPHAGITVNEYLYDYFDGEPLIKKITKLELDQFYSESNYLYDLKNRMKAIICRSTWKRNKKRVDTIILKSNEQTE